jgi:hypothetical protein
VASVVTTVDLTKKEPYAPPCTRKFPLVEEDGVCIWVNGEAPETPDTHSTDMDLEECEGQGPRPYSPLAIAKACK